MDEREGKRDFIGLICKLVELAMPELRSYYRMTRKAKILCVYASDGQYFADVQPLRCDERVEDSEPVVPRVGSRCYGEGRIVVWSSRRQCVRCAI